jgi:hypothetical protein
MLTSRTPTILDLAATVGWTTAALNWPATQGATNITFNLPELMGSNRAAFKHASSPLQALLKQSFRQDFGGDFPSGFLPRMVDRIARTEDVEMDSLVRDLALALVLRGRRDRRQIPRLMFVHFLVPDTFQHRYVPGPWVERWGLEIVDSMVGKVLRAYRRAGIANQTAVFVASDHGFATITHAIRMGALLRRERTKADYERNGHVAYVYLKGANRERRLPRIIAEIKAKKYKECVERVFLPKEYKKLGLPVPPRGGSDEMAPDENGSAPDLLVLAKTHCSFHSGRDGAAIADLGLRRYGHHGHLPKHPKIMGLMIAEGAGLVRNTRNRPLSPAYIVDIAPTLAHLLGLRWPSHWPQYAKKPFQHDGTVRRELLVK